MTLLISRLLYFVTILGWFQTHGYVPVPIIYRKADDALRRYASKADFNPLVHSLVNVLVYDKRAEAFITAEVVEQCLKAIGKWNENDELLLRQIIYGRTNTFHSNTPSSKLREYIVSALDRFLTHEKMDDYDTLKSFEN